MVTGAKAVSLLKQRCARFSGTSIDSFALDELQAAQRRLERMPELPWFLISEDTSRDLTPDEDRVPVPEDFLQELDTDALWVHKKGERVHYELTKMPLEMAKQTHGQYGDRPKAYSLVGDYFRLRPIIENMTPNTWEVVMIYYKSEPEIEDSDMTNKWLREFPDLVIAEAGLWIANSYLQNQAAAQMFQSSRQEETRRMLDFNTSRDEMNSEHYTED